MLDELPRKVSMVMGEWGNNGEDHKYCIYGNQANLFLLGNPSKNWELGKLNYPPCKKLNYPILQKRRKAGKKYNNK